MPKSPARLWPLDTMRRNVDIRQSDFIPPRTARRAYPARLYRYWIAFHALQDECLRRQRPLRVLELGIGGGQMKAFANGAARQTGGSPFACWDGVTRSIDSRALRAVGYGDVRAANLDSERDVEWIADRRHSYDALLALHVLEHLSEPEAAVKRLVPCLRPGGIMVAGTPCSPGPLRGWWERRLRRTAGPFGHVSAFSPQRAARLVFEAGLKLEWLTGAFFARVSGSKLEDRDAWTRWNLDWGSRFPSWPGECYWLSRKPEAERASVVQTQLSPDQHAIPSDVAAEAALRPGARVITPVEHAGTRRHGSSSGMDTD